MYVIDIYSLCETSDWYVFRMKYANQSSCLMVILYKKRNRDLYSQYLLLTVTTRTAPSPSNSRETQT